MLTLMSLFAFGTVWFWLFVAVHFIFFLWLIECERGGLATVTMVLTLAFLQVVGDVKPVTFAIAHPWLTLAYIGGYFVAGVGWSFGKWYFFCKRIAREFVEYRASFLEAKGVSGTTVPANLHEEWAKHKSHGRYDGRSRKDWRPQARDHKSRILTWMMYWPWSTVWTIINDPIKRAFQEIYARLQGAYQAISDSVFKEFEEDVGKK